MSKRDLSYLPLRDVVKTQFETQNATYTVKDAHPDIFDSWIRQYVEEIQNVNTAIWTVFQRWNIINELLKERIVKLLPTEEGYKLEAISEVQIEVSSSDSSTSGRDRCD